MNFNVIKDKSVGVINADGVFEYVSIYDALKDAHNIKRLAVREYCKIAYEEAAIYKFLFTFVQCAYRFHNVDEIWDVYDSGHFNPETIKQYTDKCETRGNVFDLFDEKTPFFQDPGIDTEGKPKTVGMLSSRCKTGNDLIFFGEKKVMSGAGNIRMTPQQYFAVLCRIHYCYVGSGGGKKGSGLTTGAQPPLVFIAKGKSLFETICLNMWHLENANYDTSLPMWERPEYDYRFKEAYDEGTFSNVSSVFVPVRSVRYAEVDDDLNVINIYEDKNRYFKEGYPSPSDPDYKMLFWSNDHNLVWREGKKGTFPIRYEVERDMWYAIASSCMKVNGERFPGGFLKEASKERIYYRWSIYGMIRSGPSDKFNATLYEERDVLSKAYDPTLRYFTDAFMEYEQKEEEALGKALRGATRREENGYRDSDAIKRCESEYNTLMGEIYFGEIIKIIAEYDHSIPEDFLIDSFKQRIVSEAKRVYDRLRVSGCRALINKAKYEKGLYALLKTKRKESPDE